MYKCKECGAEFDIKPDYCDCGNDTFDEILTKELSNENDVTNVTKVNNDEKLEEVKTLMPETKNTDITQKNEVQYDYSRLKRFFDPISTTIFCFCLLLSIYVILFAGNSFIKENASTPVEKVETKSVANIPDIDKLWNSAPPEVKEVVKSEEKTETQSEQSKPQSQQVEPKTVLKKPEKTQVAKSLPKINKQTTQTAKSQNQVAKPKNTKPQTASNAQNSALAKQELNNYKLTLRNRMASRIDFARVVGDGECVVVFKIDSSGRLVNRSFSKQSDNDSLNDVVYNAVMSMPTFATPPKLYKGEFLHLRVKMYGGNFEVYLF